MVDLAEALNLVVRPGLLSAKLIARKADDGESARAKLLVQALEALVLRSEAASRSRVDDENGLEKSEEDRCRQTRASCGGRRRKGRTLPRRSEKSRVLLLSSALRS